MVNYVLTPTPKTPRLFFDGGSGNFEISGRSIPENSIEFYTPLVKWLEKYLDDQAAFTTLNVNLEYFNTSSSKCLIEILRKLENIKDKSTVKVIWHYEEEDEDMMESGEDFKKLIDLPIELKVIEED